jgi:hypothetical protein
MPNRQVQDHRIAVILGSFTIVGLVALGAWDIWPGRFPVNAHDFLAAFPLAMIAFAYLAFQIEQRASRAALARALLVAAAFLFWAANQLWPPFRMATLFNDIAIALFVVDIFLTIRRRPASGDS